MDEKGFAGDPGHTGAKPMESLKGGCSGVHTQAPMHGENSGDTGGNTMTPDVPGWHTTSLAKSGGSRGVGGNDTRSKST